MAGEDYIKTLVAERIQERLQEFAEVLERGEKIPETFPCRKIRLDLKPLSYTPATVKAVRGSLYASQAVFAQLLGVSVRTVQPGSAARQTQAKWPADGSMKSSATRTTGWSAFVRPSLPRRRPKGERHAHGRMALEDGNR